jgi:hypothetical protein
MYSSVFSGLGFKVETPGSAREWGELLTFPEKVLLLDSLAPICDRLKSRDMTWVVTLGWETPTKNLKRDNWVRDVFRCSYYSRAKAWPVGLNENFNQTVCIRSGVHLPKNYNKLAEYVLLQGTKNLASFPREDSMLNPKAMWWARKEIPICRSWKTAEGCSLGNKCKWRHPDQKCSKDTTKWEVVTTEALWKKRQGWEKREKRFKRKMAISADGPLRDPWTQAFVSSSYGTKGIRQSFVSETETKLARKLWFEKILVCHGSLARQFQAIRIINKLTGINHTRVKNLHKQGWEIEEGFTGAWADEADNSTPLRLLPPMLTF